MVDFTLKNIGKGPALKCEVFCDGDCGIKWKLDDNIPPIGINETKDIRFEPEKIYPGDFDKYIRLEVAYLDIFEIGYKEEIFIDLKALLNLRLLHWVS